MKVKTFVSHLLSYLTKTVAPYRTATATNKRKMLIRNFQSQVVLYRLNDMCKWIYEYYCKWNVLHSQSKCVPCQSWRALESTFYGPMGGELTLHSSFLDLYIFFFKMINTTLLAVLVKHIKDSKFNPAKKKLSGMKKKSRNEWENLIGMKNSRDSFKKRLFIHNTLRNES